MKSRNHFPLYQIAFGVMLMMVFFGWLVVLLELVQRDAEISDARVREVEDKNLRLISERFDSGFLKGSPITEDWVSAAATTDRFAGVWREEFLEYRDPAESVSQYLAWQEGYEPFTSDDLLNNRSFLSFGDSRNGRDRLASRVLKIARDEGDEFQAVELLKEAVWTFNRTYNPSIEGDIGRSLMSPGFRLLLIKELEKHEPSPELSRLRLAEQIRAVEGRAGELPEEFESIDVRDGVVTFFYLKHQVEKLFRSNDVMLSGSPPEGRASLHIPHLKKWPYLSFKEGHRQKPLTVGWSKNAIYLIGFCTLLSTVGLIWGAIWMGRRQLQQARARTDLAASMAHELRTPLAGQRVVLESMLAKEEFDQNYLQMALRENERLGDLSEEFLTFSRLERGVLELQLTTLDLSELVSSVVHDFSAQHEEGEIAFTGASGVQVDADDAAISTIVRNLLENAWKYSREPREIAVRMIDDGFEVRDNGLGLSPAEQKKIFRQFYRVEKELSRSQDGLGLGLSIVKRLVDAMDGKVEVKSEKGKGSTFVVRFEKGGRE